MILTKRELKEWLKEAEYIDTVYDEYDSSGNIWSEDVYSYKDGNYYTIQYLNGRPVEISKPNENVIKIRQVKLVKKNIDSWEYIE